MKATFIWKQPMYADGRERNRVHCFSTAGRRAWCGKLFDRDVGLRTVHGNNVVDACERCEQVIDAFKRRQLFAPAKPFARWSTRDWQLAFDGHYVGSLHSRAAASRIVRALNSRRLVLKEGEYL